MLNAGQTDELEKMQRLAVRICFGNVCDISEIYQENEIETLKCRRVNRIDKLFHKNINNCAVKERWFL